MSTLKWILESLSVVLLTGTWAAAWRNYPRLPQTIPTHFGFDRRPDNWGRRSLIWLIPVIALLEYGALTAVEFAKSPHAVQNLMLLLKIETLGMMYYILIGMVRVALKQTDRLGTGIWAFLLLVVATSFLAPMLLHGVK